MEMLPPVRCFYGALTTAPDRMHRVHTVRRRTRPSTTARTFCKLGRNRLFVLFSAWLTL
jgi:hypothetical protein